MAAPTRNRAPKSRPGSARAATSKPAKKTPKKTAKKSSPQKAAKLVAKTTVREAAPVKTKVPHSALSRPQALRTAPTAAPRPARPPTASATPDLRGLGLNLPPDYVSRGRPEYHHEDSVAMSGVTWQPEVYELAGEFAKARLLKTVVDIGCGSGLKLEAIDVPRRVGVDFGPNLEWCREHHAWGEWIEADFETNDLRKIEPLLGPDTVIICADVVEHLIDPDPLIQLWRKAYNSGSIVITSTPDRVRVRGADHRGPPGNPAHVREWQLEEYLDLLKSRGLPVTAAGWTIDNDRDRQLMTIVTVHDGAESSICGPLLSVAGGPVRFDALRPVIDGLRATYAGPMGLEDLLALDFGGELITNGSRKGRTGGLEMSADGTRQSVRATRGSAAINPLVDRFVMLVADSEANRARSLAAEREADVIRVQLNETRARLDEANRQKAEYAEAARRTTEELQAQIEALTRRLESEIASEESRAFTSRLEQELVQLRTLIQQHGDEQGPQRRAIEAEAVQLAARLTHESEARASAEAERDLFAKKVEAQGLMVDSQRSMIELLQTEHSGLQAEALRLSRELSEHASQMDGSRIEVSTLRAEKDELATRLAQTAEAYGMLEAERNDLALQLAQAAEARSTLETERNDLAGRLSGQAATLDTQRATVELLQTEASSFQAETHRLSQVAADHARQVESLRNEKRELEARLSKEVAAVLAATTARDELSGKVAAQTATVQAQRATIELLQTETTKFQAETHRLSREMVDQARLAEAVRHEKLELSAQLSREADARRSAEAERDELASVVATQAATIEADRAALRHLQDKHEEAAGKLTAAAATVEAQRATIELLQSETANFQAETHRLAREIADVSRHLDDSRAEAGTLRSEKQQLSRQLAAESAARKELEAEHKELKDKLKAQTTDLEVQRSTNQQLRSETTRTKAEVQRLTHDVANYVEQAEALRSEGLQQEKALRDLRQQLQDSEAMREEQALAIHELKMLAKRSDIRLAVKIAENLQLRDGVWRQQNATAAATGEANDLRKRCEQLEADLEATHNRLNAEVEATRDCLKAELAAAREQAERDRQKLEHDLEARLRAHTSDHENVRTDIETLKRELADAQLTAKRLKLRMAATSLENFNLRDSVWRLQQTQAHRGLAPGHFVTQLGPAGQLNDPALAGRMHVPAPVGKIYYAVRKLAPGTLVRVVTRKNSKPK